MHNFKFKEIYDINDLIEIMSILRAPDGCPWDIEQSHVSIKKCLIEETYEVIEAINKNDSELLKEELGDVLLQVVFHSQIESESNSFNFNDVADGICKKLIIRHPHIFSDITVNSADDVITNWDEIKKKTKGQKTQSQTMDSISRELPALMRAEKVQRKAAKVGFDWNDVCGALSKLDEEICELKEAIQQGNQENISDEFGDVLFSAVNVSRFVNIEPEESLTNATDKFLSRFKIVEQLAAQRDIQISNASLEVLNSLWGEAKILINPNH